MSCGDTDSSRSCGVGHTHDVQLSAQLLVTLQGGRHGPLHPSYCCWCCPSSDQPGTPLTYASSTETAHGPPWPGDAAQQTPSPRRCCATRVHRGSAELQNR